MKEKKNYQLIAFDMDGTLLNNRNRISEATLEAIREAAEAGKHIVIATGRSYGEVAPYRDQFRDIRFAIMESGALVYDFREDKVLRREVFPQETVEALIAVSNKEKMQVQAMTMGESLIEQGFVEGLEEEGLEELKKFVEMCETIVPDVRAELQNRRTGFEKINFYHESKSARAKSLERVKDLPVEPAFSAVNSLELSPPGVSKGHALRELAEMLGVPIDCTIAVGDSGNDVAMLRAAGLAVAMGNADDELREASDVVVATNEEDGCAEAIRRFLL